MFHIFVPLHHTASRALGSTLAKICMTEMGLQVTNFKTFYISI